MNNDMDKQIQKNEKTKADKILFIVGIVLICIMAPILLLDAVLLIKGAVNPNEVPSIFGSKPLVIMSDSMEPNSNPEEAERIAKTLFADWKWDNTNPIYQNDLIFVKGIDFEQELTGKTQEEVDAYVGKTVAFKYTEPDGSWSIVVHRIGKIEKTTETQCGWRLRTYGIHNESIDNWSVDPEVVEGIWNGGRIRGIGGFVNFLQQWYGIVIFIGVPLAAVIVYDVVSSKANAKKQAEVENTVLQAEIEKLKAEKAALEQEKKEKNE